MHSASLSSATLTCALLSVQCDSRFERKEGSTGSRQEATGGRWEVTGGREEVTGGGEELTGSREEV